MYYIDPLNGNFEGAKVSPVEAAFKEHISDCLKQNHDFDPISDKMKINGDGARMSRNSNSILLLFAILQTRESVTPVKGNRTTGMVNLLEGYHNKSHLKVYSSK